MTGQIETLDETTKEYFVIFSRFFLNFFILFLKQKKKIIVFSTSIYMCKDINILMKNVDAKIQLPVFFSV